MSQTEFAPGEITDSLTGHEEMWIAEQFGKSIGELVHNYLRLNDVGAYFRALIFVLKRREDMNEDDARNFALDMKLSEVMSYFPDDADVADESGKDEPVSEQPAEQPSEPLRVISPASVS